MTIPVFILVKLRKCSEQEDYSDLLYGGEPMVFDGQSSFTQKDDLFFELSNIDDGQPFLVFHAISLKNLVEPFFNAIENDSDFNEWLKEQERIEIKKLEIEHFQKAIQMASQIIVEKPIYKTYIIQDPSTKLIKIGKSTNIQERVKSLSNTSGRKLNILLVIETDIERELHNTFSRYRGIGEWFNDKDGVILKFVKERKGGTQ